MINNNGGEYVSKEFERFNVKNGIFMNLTAPYTPQQNPVAEIGNRTTVEKSRALVKQAGMPNEFWAEAVTTAVYLENLTPVVSRHFLSPHELRYGQPPKYDHLRVFGCLAYVHIGKNLREGKFSGTAKRGVFLGYQEGHHNYRVWLLDEQCVVYSHDVVFEEDYFSFNHPLTFPHSFSQSDDYNFLDDSLTSIDSTPNSSSTKSHLSPNQEQETDSSSKNSDSDSDLILAKVLP